MSGVHRLLTRKDKKGPKTNAVTEHGDLGPVFVHEGTKKKTDKEQDKKIKAIEARLQAYGITKITAANIEYALQAPGTGGAADEALQLCLLLEDTYEGLLKSYNPSTKLLGAVNREGVTCYLDALLFAMFARLDGFEAMLYNSLEDAPRKRLAGLLRLWVNLLRTGRLITVDVTKNVQEALTACGWEAAGKLEQQDASEAFTFITGQLELPLLTLKMDLYHTGREDPDDDHKFVNERLLEVAILDKPAEGKDVVTLEDCLEQFFNNMVEVKRHMERQRRKTMESSANTPTHVKTNNMHVETVEVADMVDTPTSESPRKGPLEQLRPSFGRGRADSIFNQRKLKIVDLPHSSITDDMAPLASPARKGSMRTEVLMPAWQFFKLLPWYTDNMPTSDAQVAAHFASKRPILGICLKRYYMTTDGRCERLSTYVDIPLEIAVPDFVSDDNMEEGGPLVGNFKLVLQSVVCHRGTSLHSGHYIALVRGHASNARGTERRDSSSSTDGTGSWMLFDDLAKERIRYVDIAQALKDECPYLVFYQVQPIDEDEPLMSGPPSYDEAVSRTNSQTVDILEKMPLPEYVQTSPVPAQPLEPTESRRSPTEPPSRTSLDTDPRGRTSISSDHAANRRSAIMDATPSSERTSPVFAPTPSGPGTPSEEGRLGFLNLPSRRGSRQYGSSSKKTKSRPTSVGAENGTSGRFSLNMARITTRMSRTDMAPPPLPLSHSVSESTTMSTEASAAGEDSSARDFASPNPGSTRPSLEIERVLETLANTGGKKKGKDKEKERESHTTSTEAHGPNSHHSGKKRKGEVPERDCTVM